MFCFIPLNKLSKLLAHKEQLFTGMRHHVAVQCTQACKFLLVVAGHFVDQAALAVNHLIVADGQHKVFAERIEEAESDFVMVARTEQGVGADIAEHVVHPAHIPLEVKAQTAICNRVGNFRPCRAFLRNHQRVRMTGKHLGVQLLQKCNGFKVFFSAIFIRSPFAVAAVIVEVQHTGHRIHAQAVNMVLLQPEQRIGN